MALTTAAVVGAVATSYGAYSSKKAGDKMAGLGKAQARRQAYYDEQLRELIKDPSKIYSDAGYQEAQRQGLQAVERSGTLSGFTGSGNAAIALQKFGQSFATDYLRQQQSLLASMAGGQFNPASAMSAGVNADAQAFQQFGQGMASLGYTLGGAGSGGGSGSSGSGYGGTGWGGETSIPGTMDIGGGYIVNTPTG